LREAGIAAAEAARALTAYIDHLEADPAALEEIEARRAALARLARKYRRELPELIAWREELRAELATGEDAEGALERAVQGGATAEAAARRAGQAFRARAGARPPIGPPPSRRS